MIEKIVRDYLAQSFDIPVLLEKGENNPERYIFIEKTSGSVRNQNKRATIAIQSYAESLFEASKLNELVKLAMLDHSMVDVGLCSLNNDYPFLDTARKRYRYQAVFELVYFN